MQQKGQHCTPQLGQDPESGRLKRFLLVRANLQLPFWQWSLGTVTVYKTAVWQCVFATAEKAMQSVLASRLIPDTSAFWYVI